MSELILLTLIYLSEEDKNKFCVSLPASISLITTFEIFL